MHLLADENIPAPLVRRLRDDGHDVLYVNEAMRTAPDGDILARAIAEQRVLLTFDGDFGRMIFSEGRAPPPGVIFIRTAPPSLAATLDRVRAIVNRSSPAIDGFFVSIDRTARYHPLPSKGPGRHG